jgi:hypothetical protein
VGKRPAALGLPDPAAPHHDDFRIPSLKGLTEDVFFERPIHLCYDPTAGPARSACADPAVAAPTTEPRSLFPLSIAMGRGLGGGA